MDEFETLSFPDGPRVDLDRRLADLVRAANEVMLTQGRLRALIRATRSITMQLELPALLQTIVESAVELSGARYGALGIVGADGELEQFIHVGFDPELVALVGHLPRGEGLLGAVIEAHEPIRLPVLGDDPRAVGFPAHHPAMASFLGVPIRVRGIVYGNIYLTEHPNGSFGSEDEQLVAALAATAGFAVENARLFIETRQRQAWASASAEVAGRILAKDDGSAVSMIAGRLVELADADMALVVLLADTGKTLLIDQVQGGELRHLEGTETPLAGSLAEWVLESGNPVRFTAKEVRATASPPTAAAGPFLALPLKSADKTIGAILIGRTALRADFTEGDLGMAADFAAQASVALALSSARADQERVALFEDRGRIARDLHDRVIQQLFGTGLQLQTILGSMPPGRAASGIDAAVASLDASIAQIRTIIFTLTSTRTDSDAAGRHRIVDLVGELSARLAIDPALTFAGPIDAMLDSGTTDEVLAVVSELVTNAVKHAAARDVLIRVSADQHDLRVEVTNAGVFTASGPRSGLANLEARALARGGRMDVNSEDGTTRIRWDVPVASQDSA